MIPAIVLAAGGSKRLGTPKQLLPHGKTTLAAHAIAVALEAGLAPVFAVTGAEREAVSAALCDSGATLVANPGWREGQASSLRAGIAAVRAACPEARAVVLLACDQPRLRPSVLTRLVASWRRSGLPMAACEYRGVVGVPAVFDRSSFPELRAVRGDRGARDLLRSPGAPVCRVSWPDGAVDVDRPGDLDDT